MYHFSKLRHTNPRSPHVRFQKLSLNTSRGILAKKTLLDFKGLFMGNLTQNLFFHAILLLIVGCVLWFFYKDQPKKTKLSILNHFTDLLFYFVAAVFGTNLVLNFREILAVPYRALIFSSNVVAIATFLITVYAGITYGERFWTQGNQAKSTTQLFLFIGLVNHVYLYFIYSSRQSVLFIAFFIVLLVLTSSPNLWYKIDPLLLLLGAGLTHYIFMGEGAMLYLNFAVYRFQFLIHVLTLALILYLQRRKQPSKQT